jgi:flagellar motor switch protein FliN
MGNAEERNFEADKLVEERRDDSRENQLRRTIFSVPVTLTVSVGQAKLSVSEVLALEPDSVIPLNSRIQDPIELLVDGRVIARGDLTETEDGGLGITITEITRETIDELG